MANDLKRQQNSVDPIIDDARDRQRNTTWPGVLRGGRSVDEYLWRGAKDAPLVQRVGGVILALAYLLVALVFVAMAANGGGLLAGLFGFGLLAVGAKVVWSASRR